MYQFDPRDYERRMAWFRAARFGLFFHFGLYAIPARGEWIRSDERMSEADYQRYFDSFDPRRFDARAWARAARDAGARYAVLTAKHHDGFCLFDAANTDYKVTRTPFGRDLVREFLDAFRAEGLKVGLYYSLLDWHHPDYPHRDDRYHPSRGDASVTDEGRIWARYVAYFHEQVRQLCSEYGRIDLMWFDFSYDDKRGEAWRAAELTDMVRSLQPDIIVNNRLEVSGEGFGSLYECAPTPWHGDFVTPEKMIPPDGLRDVRGGELAWESCVTMNNNWGYVRTDRHYKSPALLIRKLVECVSLNGNMILNIGPRATGDLPPEALDTLAEIGRWMRENGESICGCGRAGLPKPDFGRFTRNGDTLYLHLFENALGPLPVPHVRKDAIRAATLLADGSEVPISTSWVHSDYPDICFLDLGPDPALPEEADTVIKIALKSQDQR